LRKLGVVKADGKIISRHNALVELLILIKSVGQFDFVMADPIYRQETLMHPNYSLKAGDQVKMSPTLKANLIANGCQAHLDEFGDCVGIVEGLVFEDDPFAEVNIRWEPSGLRYGYDPLMLEKVS
jgi:hypothetical protein